MPNVQGIRHHCAAGPRSSDTRRTNHDNQTSRGQIDREGVFPFRWPTYPYVFDQFDGPRFSDLAALYFAAIFYDIAVEAGLGRAPSPFPWVPEA